MLENWIFLTLLAPLFWASSNFVDKYLLGKYTKGIYDFLFFSAITNWIFVIVLILIKGFPSINSFSWIPLATGAILLYSYGFYAKALETEETSTLVILFKLIPVLTVVLAFIFLGQRLSANELLGFIVVFSGTLIISLEKSKGHSNLIKGFSVIIIAILMWATLFLFIDYGLTKIDFWSYFTLDIIGSGIAGLSLFLVPSMRREAIAGIKEAGTKKYSYFTGNNLLDFFGQMSMKKALALSPSVGLVTVISQVQSFYAILIGVLLTLLVPHIIREDISGGTLIKKFIGAAIMFLGIYILLS